MMVAYQHVAFKEKQHDLTAKKMSFCYNFEFGKGYEKGLFLVITSS